MDNENDFIEFLRHCSKANIVGYTKFGVVVNLYPASSENTFQLTNHIQQKAQQYGYRNIGWYENMVCYLNTENEEERNSGNKPNWQKAIDKINGMKE